MTIDPKKTYRTRDGREVRIYTVDGGGKRPVHGAMWSADCHWSVRTWRADGSTAEYMPTDYDLIETKPRIKREVWVNVYPFRNGVPSENKAYVDAHRGKDCIACVKVVIDCEEGQGL